MMIQQLLMGMKMQTDLSSNKYITCKTGKHVKLHWNNTVKNVINNLKFYTFSDAFVKIKINLNDKFPLKIAKISLQKHNFPGMRFPNSTFCPCMTTCVNCSLGKDGNLSSNKTTIRNKEQGSYWFTM